VERGFRFLKDHLFFAHSLFLEKPERLMALLMIMGLSLLIYSLAERKLCHALKEMNATVPDQRRKPTQRPIIRWIFQLFEGLDILLVKQNGEVMLRQLPNLRPAQEQVINLLGPQVQKCYLFGLYQVRNVGYKIFTAFILELQKGLCRIWIGARLESW